MASTLGEILRSALNKQGRKTIAKDGEKMRNRNFRATDAEWEKCLQLGGGSFLRAKIKAAKVGHNVQIEARPAFGASLSNAGLGSAKGEK